MLLSIEANLEYRCDSACNFLLQIEAAQTHHQNIIEADFSITPDQDLVRSSANDGIGTRMWLHVKNEFKCTYHAKIEIVRNKTSIERIQQSPMHDIKDEVTKYLLPSRYCHLEKFEDAIPEQFTTLSGGDLVLALCDWMKNEFEYIAGVSNASTAGHDTLKTKQGVCRDYAHVLISMLRMVAIPARIVSAYSPSVKPQDFHALVEVYLDGAWYLVDPTGMTKSEEVAIIGIGRDAADISFLTAYGFLTMIDQSVIVNIID